MMDEPLRAALTLSSTALAIYLLIIGVGLRVVGRRVGIRVLIGGALLVFGIAFVWIRDTAELWRFAAFFGCGVAVVLFTYGAVLKALSLRMLMALSVSPNDEATIAQLTEDVVRVAFDERIRLLEERRLIRPLNGGYMLTPAGEQAAVRIRRAQEILGIGPAGFYWD